MATTRSRDDLLRERLETSITRSAQRFGYVVAAAINAVALWIAHQLLDWEWPEFLTSDYDELLPIVTVSFVASILANLVFAWNDGWPVKPLGRMVTAVLGFAVALRTWRVFPFDFSGSEADWSWLARTILVVVLLGTAIGFVAESVKLLTGPRLDEEVSP